MLKTGECFLFISFLLIVRAFKMRMFVSIERGVSAGIVVKTSLLKSKNF